MEEPSYEEVQELSEELLKFADMEGTEAGEYWKMIAELNSRYYVMSPKFYLALKRELIYQLKDIKKNYEIVESQYEVFGAPNAAFGEIHKQRYLKFKD